MAPTVTVVATLRKRNRCQLQLVEGDQMIYKLQFDPKSTSLSGQRHHFHENILFGSSFSSLFLSS